MLLEDSEFKPEPILPRFFWRRSFAVFVDLFLVAILFTLLVAMIQPFVSFPLIAPSALHFTSCADVTESQRSLPVIQTMKLQSNETLSVSRCEISNMGLLRHSMLSVSAVKIQGNATFTRSVVYPVNDQNEFTVAFDTSPFLWLFAPAIFAAFTFYRRQTPGKTITSLQIVSIQGLVPQLGSLVKREYLRLWFFVVIGIVSIAQLLFFDQTNTPEEMAKSLDGLMVSSWPFALLVLVPILFLSPYLFSLLRWNGQMFYDKITGFVVKKVMK